MSQVNPWLTTLRTTFEKHAVKPYRLDPDYFIKALDDRITQYVNNLMPEIVKLIRKDTIPAFPELPKLKGVYPAIFFLTNVSKNLISEFAAHRYNIHLNFAWLIKNLANKDELCSKIFAEPTTKWELEVMWKTEHIRKYALQVELKPQQTDLHKTLMQLLYPNLNDTITFKVYKTDSSNYQLITIHQNLVQFFSDNLMCRARVIMADSKSMLEIDNEDPENFKQLKEYFYLGELKETNIATLCDMYVVADKYLINHLKNYITNTKFYEYLQANSLNDETLNSYIQLLKLSLTYDIKEIISCILKRAEQSNQCRSLIKKIRKGNTQKLSDFANNLHLPNIKECLKKQTNTETIHE